MITREDIAYFYEQYMKNLDEETSISESVLHADSEKVWLDSVYSRKERMSRLYEKNGVLLEKYLHDFLNEKVELNEEQAEEFLEQITNYAKKGYSDLYGGVDMLHVVEQYFLKNNDRDNYIRTAHILGALHIKYSVGIASQVSLDYARKVTDFSDIYTSIEDWDIRRIVLVSWLNYCVALVNGRDLFADCEDRGQDILLKAYKDAVGFYSRPDVIELDGDKIDIDAMVDNLGHILFSSWLGNIDSFENIKPEFLETADKVISKMYANGIKDGTPLHMIDDEVYCSYWICAYLEGAANAYTLVTRIYEYCKEVLEKVTPVMDEDFYDSQYFRVCMYQLPNLLKYIRFNGISESFRAEITQFTLDTFLNLLNRMPLFRSSSIVNGVIIESAMTIARFLPLHISPFGFLQRVFAARDESIMLHANMVRQMALIISERMFSLRPDLFIGIHGAEYVADVLRQQEEIVELIRQSSSMFDIGMFEYSVLVQKTGRPLSRREKDLIKGHCEAGYKMLSQFKVMDGIKDVVLGHHKSYDGKSGYPSNFDNTRSPFRIIIDLIRICDDMDAATDFIGRNYKHPITFLEFLNELKAGAGTKYNPQIVNLIVNDEKLRTRLAECCETGRDRAYYGVYNEFFRDREENNIPPEDNSTPQTANKWAESFLVIMQVDLMKDEVNVVQQRADSIINIQNGSFSTLLQYHIKNNFHPDDWRKYSFLLMPGALPDKLYLHQGNYEADVRVKHVHADGYRWIRFQFFVIEEKYGIAKKVMVFASDVDEQKRQSVLLEESLELARQEAKAANVAKSMFISNISHEIRTPMNAIVGMTEILLRENLTDLQREYLENIKSSGNALVALINDILDFSKMESGKLDIVNDKYSIMSMLNDMSMIFLNRIGEKPIELLFDIDKEMPNQLFGDALRLRQVIINIVNNAIKFTDEGFIKLVIRVNRIIGNKIELFVSVEDTGTGIKEEDMGRLFGQFTQLDIKRNHEKEGTGLGLVISKQLIELMGGHMEVSSTYGEGSKFSFTVIQGLNEEVKDDTLLIKAEKVEYEYATVLKATEKKVKVGCLAGIYVADALQRLCEAFEVEYCDLKQGTSEVDYVFADVENLNIAKSMFPDDDKTKICLIYNPMIENIKDERAKIVNKPLYSLNFCQILNNEKAVMVKTVGENYLDFTAKDARILIVDDTEMNLKVARGLFAPIQMHIETASSGMEALKFVEKREYDLIFMDHKMPGMDGVETTERIRAMEGDYFKKVPIIALTANAVLSARSMFEAAGMNDFVAKPIEMKDVCNKLKKWLPADKIQKVSKDLYCNLADKQFVLENDTAELPEIEGINLAEGIKNSGGKMLLSNLLCDYYRMIDTKASKIQQYLQEGCIKEYVVEVHALKSVSRLIGALDMSEEFKFLEKTGDLGDIKTLEQDTPGILAHYREFKKKLKEYVQAKDNAVEKHAIEKDVLIQTLNDISEQMENFDIDAVDELMKTLEGYKLPAELNDLMEQLRMYVADVAIEDVINVVSQMVDTIK